MHVSVKVNAWKQKLLDLGKRNRLLFFKPTKRTTVRIVEPDLGSIFRGLVHEGNSFEFPLPATAVADLDLEGDGESVEEQEAPVLRPGQLRTEPSGSNLMRNLHQIRQKAKTALEEQGVNILYLAFGMLEWTEADASREVIRSPLVLVPVALQYESILDPYVLAPYDDDLTINPTLLHKLQMDFGVTLPPLPDEDDWDLEDYLETVERQVVRQNWRVVREAQLGLFSFQKLNMYKDLDSFGAAMAEHPIIAAIACEPVQLPAIPEETSDPETFDRTIYPHETFQVLDADSSQQEAILAAKRGASFVLQGPPGTGKSQTITNIIAECLSQGKRILFVSEKMAALDVVFRRLQENGLGDFCLQLHSHKANKRDVIAELGRTLYAAKTAITPRVEEQLDQLLEQKEHLNKVVNALHTVREPLSESIYQVHGRVASLESAPNLSFRLSEGAFGRTPADLRRFSSLLDQLAATARKVGGDYAANPWRGCVAPAFSLQLQQDIQTEFGRLRETLGKLTALFDEAATRLGLGSPETLSAMDRALELYALVGESPMPPAEWFAASSLEPLVQAASEYLDLMTLYQERRARLLSRFQPDLLGLETASRLACIEENPRAVLREIAPQYVRAPAELIKVEAELLGFLEGAVAKLSALQQAADALAKMLSMPKAGSVQAIRALVAIGQLVARDPRPVPAWFEEPSLRVALGLAREAMQTYATLQATETELLSRFDREILTVDPTGILHRFRTAYTGMFRFLNPAYHRDMKTLRRFSKAGGKLTHTEAVAALTQAKSVLEGQAWVREHEQALHAAFGAWFMGKETPWPELVRALETCGEILHRFRPELPPEALRQLLLRSGSGVQAVASQTRTVELALAEAAPLLDLLEARLRPGAAENRNREIGEEPLDSLIARASTTLDALRPFYQAFHDVARYCLAAAPLVLSDIVATLREVEQVQEIEERLRRETEALLGKFGSFFRGTETEWTAVLSALDWTAKVTRHFGSAEPPERFIQAVCGRADVVNETRRAVLELGTLRETAERHLQFVLKLFEPNTLNAMTLPVPELDRWLEERLQNLRDLEDWIDFRVSREECTKAGLGSFVTEALGRSIPPDQLKPAFYKRFYRLWLDEIYAQVPELQSFRGRRHEERIQEFRQLDRLQFKLAQVRLRAKLSALRPNPNAMAARGSEISVLQRETEKRSRQMPLRKLFLSIPNLLLTLKPCLLMSPLSVSQFLDPRHYQFDVVIFDEASQICTEDAIGAIFRGKQIIVVGDREQLPPTNFFGASTGDSSYDDEDDDTGSYESILDECSGVLNRKSLRWHYRSRHEHLITFSNVEIYQNLVTFPSPVDRAPDMGVEYIFVPDGVYDRAATRSNRVEARRTAQLVFDHFRRFPNRSLGVVTFSEAQQAAVDAEVRAMRLQNPEFESFFSEERHEPFFIKNLENVQGDERDTIIFSVGYAKDAAGVMHMNFGPLSKQGGHRRLNVAITRAKYNVKLVTSMRPTDIDLERTTAEGVRMLRRYMEFAKDGPKALLRQLSVSDTPQFDSPFEEAVYKELIHLGYEVDTQVGCSGYRIDLAVRDPKVSGRYILGIECDGRTYHSSKTARDRDRLREDVLQGLGWRIHRIWSTDWIKDPRAELQRLVQAITAAEEAAGVPETARVEPVPEVETTIEEDPGDLEVEVKSTESSATALPAGVTMYREANIWAVARNGLEDGPFAGVVMAHVIATEGPIHQEALAQRLAPLWGRKRVSDSLRQEIEYVARHYAAGRFLRRGEFYWPAGLQNVPVRVPASFDKPRPIGQICIEERAEAIYLTLQKAVGIRLDDLITATAHLLGYHRTGGQIREALEEAADYLVRAGRIEVVEGTVRITRRS